MIHFIAQLRIYYDNHPHSADPYTKCSEALCSHISEILKSFGFEVMLDTETSQPDVYFGETNTYICVDVMTVHRTVNHLRSVSTLVKLVEGHTEYLAVHYDATIEVSYLDELPPCSYPRQYCKQ